MAESFLFVLRGHIGEEARILMGIKRGKWKIELNLSDDGAGDLGQAQTLRV